MKTSGRHPRVRDSRPSSLERPGGVGLDTGTRALLQSYWLRCAAQRTVDLWRLSAAKRLSVPTTYAAAATRATLENPISIARMTASTVAATEATPLTAQAQGISAAPSVATTPNPSGNTSPAPPPAETASRRS